MVGSSSVVIDLGPLKGRENLDSRISVRDNFGAALEGRLPKRDGEHTTRLEEEQEDS